MTDLDPCLFGCDNALAEADLLLLMLSEYPASLESELIATRARIAALRREVERLRGMTTVPARRRIQPDWTDLTSDGSPWAARGPEIAGRS